jgi:hypothetical protein
MIPTKQLRDELFNFVEEQCTKYKIDSSHGIIHSKRCVHWADLLIDYENNLSHEEKLIIVYAVAIHDLCDKKYTVPSESISKLQSWLERVLTDEMVTAILFIIQTMSYSYLNLHKEKGYPNHEKWSRAYHIARHADLLDGYHVGRCVLYTQHSFSHLTNDEIWNTAQELFERRMFKYVSDGWITHPCALLHVPKLIEKANQCFSTRQFTYVSKILDVTV